MFNGWRNKVHLQDLEYDIPFKKTSNMFEQMEMADIIYKGVVAPYKTPTDWSNDKCAGIDRKQKVEPFSSTNNSNNGGCSGKCKTRNIGSLIVKLMGKHFMIHSAGHSSEEFKVCQTLKKNHITAIKLPQVGQWTHYTRGKHHCG